MKAPIPDLPSRIWRIRQLHGFFEAEDNAKGPGFDHFKKTKDAE